MIKISKSHWILSIITAILFIVVILEGIALVYYFRIGGTTQQNVIPDTNTPSVVNETTSTGEAQMAQLTHFITSTLAVGIKTNRLIAYVDADSANPYKDLEVTQETTRQCWFSQEGSLKNCQAKTFVEAFRHETTVPWKYSYMIFAIVSVTEDFSQATVRMDEYNGPKASSGYIITLVRGVNDEWYEVERKSVWVS